MLLVLVSHSPHFATLLPASAAYCQHKAEVDAQQAADRAAKEAAKEAHRQVSCVPLSHVPCMIALRCLVV
jgi:hypothetical protein